MFIGIKTILLDSNLTVLSFDHHDFVVIMVSLEAWQGPMAYHILQWRVLRDHLAEMLTIPLLFSTTLEASK